MFLLYIQPVRKEGKKEGGEGGRKKEGEGESQRF